MTKFIDNTYTVFNNPFLLAPILVAFYKNCSRTEDNFLLSYLVFPLVLSREGQELLKNVSVRTRLVKLEENNKVLFFRLHARFQEYKQLTNDTLQHCIDNGYLILDGLCLTVEKKAVFNPGNPSLRRAVHTAEKLGVLFSKYEIATIYRFLGFRTI